MAENDGFEVNSGGLQVDVGLQEAGGKLQLGGMSEIFVRDISKQMGCSGSGANIPFKLQIGVVVGPHDDFVAAEIVIPECAPLDSLGGGQCGQRKDNPGTNLKLIGHFP